MSINVSDVKNTVNFSTLAEEMLSVDDRPPQTTADAFVGERCVRPMRRHYSAKWEWSDEAGSAWNNLDFTKVLGDEKFRVNNAIIIYDISSLTGRDGETVHLPSEIELDLRINLW